MNTFNKTFCSWRRGCGRSLQELSCFSKFNCLDTMLSQQCRIHSFTLSFFTRLCQKPTLATEMIGLCFNKLAPPESLHPSRGTGSQNVLSLTSLSCYLLEMSLGQGLWEFGVKRSLLAHKEVIYLSVNTLGYT